MESSTSLQKAAKPLSPLNEAGKPIYQWERQLGRGSFGSVWKAKKDGNTIAVKIVRMYHPRLLPNQNEEIRDQVIAETRLLYKGFKNCKITSLACFYDYLAKDGNMYIEMEYIDGINLAQYTKEYLDALKKNLEEGNEKQSTDVIKTFENSLVDITHSILPGLRYLHSQQIIHRDIKPENILLQNLKNGSLQPKLIDIGLGCFTYSTQVYTGDKISNTFCQVQTDLGPEEISCCHNNKRAGTPYFMAPETLLYRNNFYESDIWSLGATIFYCATGDHVFEPKVKTVEALFQMAATTPIPLAETNNYLLTTLIHSSLELNIFKRGNINQLLELIKVGETLKEAGLDYDIHNMGKAVQATHDAGKNVAYKQLYETYSVLPDRLK